MPTKKAATKKSNSSTAVPAPQECSQQPPAQLHKRSRSGTSSMHVHFCDMVANLEESKGCYTCRLRRKKCDESHPACRACSNLCVKCEYKRPIWWSNAEQRAIQKERIKNKIKQTKLNERNSMMAGGVISLFLADRVSLTTKASQTNVIAQCL